MSRGASDGQPVTAPARGHTRPATSHIRLLGSPEVMLDGAPAPAPRGRKSWAVLAYLLLARDRPTRPRLAELCFPDALDPRGTLRWALADLRHLLGGHGDVSGDPVELTLPRDVVVDVWQVLDGGPEAEAACLRGELLEGLSFSSSEPLERWLGFERQRLGLAAIRVLQAAATEARQAGQMERAARLAADLVALDPYGRPEQ